MELTGNLSDFALTDILQILALSRKTGVLSLEGADFQGKIFIEDGRVTFASLQPGETLADRLVREQKITTSVMKSLNEVAGEEGVWGLESLIIESGVMTKEELESAAKRHIRSVVASLIGIGKGRFWIDLNQDALLLPPSEIKLGYGLDIAEVLLEAAKEADESNRRRPYEPPSPPPARVKEQEALASIRSLVEGEDTGRAANNGNYAEFHSSISNVLYSLLMELRSHSFEVEVSLLVMRYASEICSRGVLFLVRENEICGLGQFGFKTRAPDKSVDEEVRDLRLALDSKSIFTWVAQTGRPYIGPMPEDPLHTAMLSHLGGSPPGLSVFVLPLICRSRPMFIIYGDNYPGGKEMKGVNELVVLVNQASMVLEKIQLERMIKDLKEPVVTNPS
ncbi:MAG: DUF4388 domain-containing protein [Acidobacteriota bacterium]